MESEKVKEIKELFKNCDFTLKHCGNCVLWKDEDCIETIKSKVLTLINELESENETLRNAKVIHETVDYCAEDLRKAQERIVELKKENKELAKQVVKITGCSVPNEEVDYECNKKLKQFAERLKERVKVLDKWYSEEIIDEQYNGITAIEIDETLKGFIEADVGGGRMREILFRGKTEDGKWVDGYYVKGATRHCIKKSLAEYLQYDVIPETVGQFTGLTDKNGKKIFEGDIVKATGTNDHIGYVEFECGKFIIRCTCHPKSVCDIHPSIEEIIGNIHDNPELLEVEE